jgi:hypothetical protein
VSIDQSTLTKSKRHSSDSITVGVFQHLSSQSYEHTHMYCFAAAATAGATVLLLLCCCYCAAATVLLLLLMLLLLLYSTGYYYIHNLVS